MKEDRVENCKMTAVNGVTVSNQRAALIGIPLINDSNLIYHYR